MCYVSVLFSIPNLIIWKKYKKIYICYMREVRFYLFVAIPWNVGRILMSSRVLVCVFQHKSFMSLLKTEIVASNFMKTTKMIVQNASERETASFKNFETRYLDETNFIIVRFQESSVNIFGIILFEWKLYVVWKKRIF